MKLGVLSSFHQQCMWLNLKVVMIKKQWYFVYEVVPFTSKHRCFYRKHPHYKCNILFLIVLNPTLLMCSPPSIHTNILNFQEVWSSFDKYCALIDMFLEKCP